MHELTVTQNVLDIAIEHARQGGATRITRINLVIGEMSSIIDDSVQFYFDFISKGTMAEGAELQFRRIPAQFRCSECGQMFTPEGDDYRCPRCAGLGIVTDVGSEFYVESIEVD
ncbi:MAG: hydrogenase maturation nickel metallochaperone HypA [Chloroflexi bacterium]|nr:hydrogenase maturation nickel metallochaperone HypA [Chloroflexota bacterium]